MKVKYGVYMYVCTHIVYTGIIYGFIDVYTIIIYILYNIYYAYYNHTHYYIHDIVQLAFDPLCIYYYLLLLLLYTIQY